MRIEGASMFLVLVCCALGLALTAFAHPGANAGSNAAVGDRSEVLIGSYSCGAGPDTASIFLSASGTGDLLEQETYMYRSVSVVGSPGETCDRFAQAPLAAVQGAGCRASPIEARSDDYGEERSFRFVCHAPRSQIVEIYAGVASDLLTLTP